MIERNRKKLETEQEIAQSVAAGDAKAIKELYDHTVGYMTSVATRYLGDSDDVCDVLQDAYVYLISHIGTFEYRGEGSLRAWMSRIVANKAIDHLKAMAKHERLFVAQDPPDLPDDDCDADQEDPHLTEVLLSRSRRAIVWCSTYSFSKDAVTARLPSDSASKSAHRHRNCSEPNDSLPNK